MQITLNSKEGIHKMFVDLGYSNNPVYDFDKNLNGLDYDFIKNMHMLSETKGFKIWLFEIEKDSFKADIMNRIATSYANTNILEFNLLIFVKEDYSETVFLHYDVEDESGKIKIRRLKIENNIPTTTDIEIIDSIKIKNEEDDYDIWEKHEDSFSIEKVTKKFFDEFQKQVEYVSKNISGLTKKEDKKNYAVLLVSRMIFLYFIQKKGWLNGKKDFLYDRFLYAEDKNENYYKYILEPLFFECLNVPTDKGMLESRSNRAKELYENFESYTRIERNPSFEGIPYLNGGLFERHPKYEIDKKIRIENKVFKKLFEELLNKYNFTVREDLGYDTEIAVDPELLGRIFENMINIAERKGTGSFYTPRPIIVYMCKEAIKSYLTTNTKKVSKEKIEYLIDNLEEESLYSKERKVVKTCEKSGKRIEEKTDGSIFKLTKIECSELYELIAKVTVCDPAVGSGAYILGMLQLLLILRKKLYFYMTKKTIDLYQAKRDIIEKNLFGVDIQEGAIDIAHLRLWLSLSVEHDAKSIDDIKPLPNLGYKIMKGNSLISVFNGVDFDDELKKMKNSPHQTSMFEGRYQDTF